ncbi:EthD family reductase [Roseateles sp. DB2]|uniref:EthD family reductase n=1 Tax=Roseateles sp. DB2 TaxID=3453717 RepID=UPI003EE9E17C
MIRVMGLYHWAEGARFDAACYAAEHAALARRLLTPLGLQRLELARFLGAAPPRPGELIAATFADFSDLPSAQSALAAAGPALAAHVSRYSSLQPQIHLCELLV